MIINTTMFKKIKTFFKLFFFDTFDYDFVEPVVNESGRIEVAVNEVGEKIILEFPNVLYMHN
jgi:hypothetical protein